MSIKDAETEKPYFKARSVAKEHRDREKATFVKDSTTVCQSSIRFFLALDSVFRLLLCSIDVNAYGDREGWVAVQS